MAANQDISSLAEAHTVSYIEAIISPAYTTSLSRATKMASFYLPNIAAFTNGAVSQLSDPAILVTLIADILAKLETGNGLGIKEKEHRVETVGERSAIAWITLTREEIVWTNVYFFRRLESGEVGWEGGITDGEMGMLKQLGKA